MDTKDEEQIDVDTFPSSTHQTNGAYSYQPSSSTTPTPAISNTNNNPGYWSYNGIQWPQQTGATSTISNAVGAGGVQVPPNQQPGYLYNGYPYQYSSGFYLPANGVYSNYPQSSNITTSTNPNATVSLNIFPQSISQSLSAAATTLNNLANSYPVGNTTATPMSPITSSVPPMKLKRKQKGYQVVQNGPAPSGSSNATTTAAGTPTKTKAPRKPRAKKTVVVPPPAIPQGWTGYLPGFLTGSSSISTDHPILYYTLQQFPMYEILASPPTPPGWEKSCREMIATSPLNRVHQFTLDPNSNEYQIIYSMIQPCPIYITGISRVFNPTLWKKFLNHRKETISLKSRDLQLLARLGVGDDEIASHANVNFNFVEDPNVAKVEYSDNLTLLYHGTKAAVQNIIEEGLDERLGYGGLLGRGIYFSDDPNKAMQYDSSGKTLLVFAVFLGDCLGFTHGQTSTAATFTREPNKSTQQQRNHRDTFFDSIVGRPASHNEFVIYNRYQCVPMYIINYTNSRTNGTSNSIFDKMRKELPPFAWSKTGPPAVTKPYPFYAQTVFKVMHDTDTVDKKDDDPTSGVAAAVPEIVVEDDKDGENIKLAVGLSELTDLGFLNDAKNTELLKKYKFDVTQVINELVELSYANADTGATAAANSTVQSDLNANNFGQSSTATNSSVIPNVANWVASIPSSNLLNANNLGQSSSAGNNNADTSFDTDWVDSILSNMDFDSDFDGFGLLPNCANIKKPSATATSTITRPDPEENEECPICFEEYKSNCVSSWKKLTSCTHKICTNCHGTLSKSGTTMAGVTHSYLKCPFCSSCSGIETGSCPDGTMTCTTTKKFIQINYQVPSHGVRRTAYIPNNPDGLKTLELLKIAWDRRLIFAIGTSATTGQVNTVVWNIHHKTAMTGGVMNYGYPDPTYFLRVQQELKQYGIE